MNGRAVAGKTPAKNKNRGYTVATFRATLRAILDQRLPSSHAMMFTSRNPKWRRLAKKALGVLALMLLDGEEKARIKRRNRRVWVKADKRSE